MKDLKEQTLDLLTRLLEGNMLSVKGDELVQAFISKILDTPQQPHPEVSEEETGKRCLNCGEPIDLDNTESYCNDCL